MSSAPFKEQGLDALDPKRSGDAPRRSATRCASTSAGSPGRPPADWKTTAFSTWSLSKLTDHLVKQKVTATIGRQALRRILRAGEVS
ncbi:hypothetical protein LE181_06580 [Streptomyces sp. SCA3-4]|uniref:hypothetical protein n=1 Tax=Streptomyces sichuanensis TaxID=2871810 RepID=UPI001CE242A2|nr:hypothetical protein [Streptomyces sichuanensis]MCA6091830.1 hypothetical protein [Streptomyces sichuanensis]